jgi:hypothetical protein
MYVGLYYLKTDPKTGIPEPSVAAAFTTTFDHAQVTGILVSYGQIPMLLPPATNSIPYAFGCWNQLADE